MIVTELRDVVAYRMHTPRWATQPTSGEGAALHGGRANRIGLAALYLAMETETAIREYQQLSTLMPPGTLVAYTVTLSTVADFRSRFDPAHWDALWSDFYCDWRALWFDRRIEPPSWVIGDMVYAAGHAGILFPSAVAPGGTNLVAYPDRLEPGNLQVFDPMNALPRNQKSWE